MAPVVHGLEAKYAGKVNFYYLDADDPATTALQKEYEFLYQPFFILLDANGNEVKRWAGYVQPEEFEAAFANLPTP
jgi:thioredoxin-related protein